MTVYCKDCKFYSYEQLIRTPMCNHPILCYVYEHDDIVRGPETYTGRNSCKDNRQWFFGSCGNEGKYFEVK